MDKKVDAHRLTLGTPPAANNLLAFALAAAISPASLTVFAQTAPDAGSLLRQQEQIEQQVPPQLPEPEAPVDESAAPEMLASSVKVTVREVRFSGNLELAPETELQAVIADAQGQELDFSGLQALADKVTAHLREGGWLLARAYLPQQDVTEGVVEIAILKGRLDGNATEGGGWAISLNEGARVDAGTLSAIVETAAPSGSTARQGELERALLLMNDLPGVSVRSRLAPGSETGTTRVNVDAVEGPLFTGIVWADNYGNSSTGENQLSAALHLNDPSRRGDHASLSVTASEGVRVGQLGYSIPLNPNGLRASAGYTTMNYEVKNGSGVAAGLEGDSRIIHAGLAYPFIRTRALNLHGDLDLAHKALKDDSDAGDLRDKRVDVVTLGLSGDRLDGWKGGGLNNFNASLTTGDLDLSGVPADEAADAATLDTQGGYTRFNVDASRLQRLPGSFTLFGRLSAQWAGDNLDSSEQFILGGPGGVRAYPVGEAQGDSGWLASMDLRYDWPDETPLGVLQLSAFVDTGRVQLHDDPGAVAIATATGKNEYQLSGVGFGVNVGVTGSHSLRLAWAHTLGNNDGRSPNGDNADGDSDDSRFWLQGVVWF
ncbi:MAG: ShlB/FhaC/HecB family hemolysin secretion/activation protein [Gammaproteobacteria bacterium]|nr:ShlB/FhaC/HecB family hemolysin secretion/activation protein [Gammaproteobacteria bacterium]